MFSQGRVIVTWALAILFAGLTVAGEALHWLPGCAHGVMIFGRVLYVGVARTEGPYLVCDDGPALSRPTGPQLPILGEGQCPICSHFSHAQSPAAIVHFVLELPLAEKLPVVGAPSFHCSCVPGFHSRAPPLA